MRPIDADALIHHFYETEYASMYYIEVVKRIIDAQPTISPDDVRGVGEWKEIEVMPKAYDICGVETWASKMQCCNCGFTTFAIEGHFSQHNFCPSCGARMKGAEDGTTDNT